MAGSGLNPAGTVFTIEPMITAGRVDNKVMPDKWTIVTKDRKPAAHFEHTIAVTADGPRILTSPTDRAALWAGAPPRMERMQTSLLRA